LGGLEEVTGDHIHTTVPPDKVVDIVEVSEPEEANNSTLFYIPGAPTRDVLLDAMSDDWARGTIRMLAEIVKEMYPKSSKRRSKQQNRLHDRRSRS